MTQTNILEHKKKVLEQRLHRLKAQETILKMQERKSRTRRLIDMGGLVDKAGLSELPANVFYGALLFVKEKLNDETLIQAWEKKGGAASAEEDAKSKAVVLVVQFHTQPSQEVIALMRQTGLKWNQIRKEWQGKADFETMTKLLDGQNAEIIVLERDEDAVNAT